MEITLRPSKFNINPPGGILVRGASPTLWIRQMEMMGLTPETANAFFIPGTVANSIWGCFLLPNSGKQASQIGANQACQKVHALLYIPEYAELFPKVSDAEISILLQNKPHIFHPEFGLVSLSEPVLWESLLIQPEIQPIDVRRPENSVFIPMQLFRAQIQPPSEEDILASIEKSAIPEKKQFRNDPLNGAEKIKLQLYKSLLGENKEKGSKEPGKLDTGLSKLASMLFGENSKFMQNMALDYQDLEERNKKNMEKLLDLLKNNPEEALKYAIPLDGDGVERGGDFGLFEMNKRWFDFNLFQSEKPTSTSGGSLNMDMENYRNLHQHYHDIASELLRKKDYQKAAFVYLKLLKNRNLAASALEQGSLFAEAATLYKQDNQLQKAAECYEKGRMWKEAIEIYKTFDAHEKIGDLYMLLHQKQEAFVYYNKVTEKYEEQGQYLKASFIYKNKMQDFSKAQWVLKKGWTEGKDSFNCLNNYLEGLGDPSAILDELKEILRNNCDGQTAIFIEIVRTEFEKMNGTSADLRSLAYEAIGRDLPNHPHLVSRLTVFHPKDMQLAKDTLRFTQRNKRTGWDWGRRAKSD